MIQKTLIIEKKKLRAEFVMYKYAEKVQLLSTMKYKDIVLFKAIQNKDVDKLFEIMHQRLIQSSVLYRLKVRLGFNRFKIM